jgi:hypothetical protein
MYILEKTENALKRLKIRLNDLYYFTHRQTENAILYL